MCRLHQLAAKKGLEVDWVRSFQERENSNSSGDQGTETAISLSRCRILILLILLHVVVTTLLLCGLSKPYLYYLKHSHSLSSCHVLYIM